MSAAQHTPGPWVFGDWVTKAKGHANDAMWVEVWSEAETEHRGLPFAACKHYDEIANARLIAAAPDLLNALRELLDCPLTVSDIAVIRSARAAIAKAEGVGT